MRDAHRSQQVFAKQLRKAMPDTERTLWQAIRQRQLSGHRFRRQVVVGPYIVDFACLEQRLIVEVDGGQHAEAVPYDARRDAFLIAQGYRVLRFWNNEVTGNMTGVLETILAALTAPHPNPPPQAGEGTGEGAPFPPLQAGEGTGEGAPFPPPRAGEGQGGGGLGGRAVAEEHQP